MVLILSWPFSIQGRQPCFWDIVQNKNLKVDLHMFFKLGMAIETIEIHSLVSVKMTLTFIRGHSCTRNKKKTLGCPLSGKFCSGFG